MRAALYEGGRRSEESLGQYSLRKEAQFATAAKYLELPSKLKGFMLEEQASLSKQALRNSEYEAVKQALRVIDTEEESLCRSSKGASFWQGEEVVTVEKHRPPDEEGSEDEGDFLDTDQVQEIFYAIENLDLCEGSSLELPGRLARFENALGAKRRSSRMQ